MGHLYYYCSINEFRRADLKPSLGAEIALALGGAPFNGDIVAHRWKNMKDTFMSNWNKVTESKNRCSGNEADDMYKPKWPLYSSLLFLKKTVVTSNTVSNIPESKELESSGSQVTLDNSDPSITSEICNIYYDENTKQYMVLPADVTNSNHSSSNTSLNSESLSSSTVSLLKPGPSSVPEAIPFNIFNSPPPRPSSAPSAADSKKDGGDNDLFVKRGTTKRKSNTLMEEAVKAVKQLASHPIPTSEILDTPNDGAHYFGMFVASRLRDMDKEARKLCETELMSVLYKY